jgi:phosphatidylglycerol:prolipoprotein diacylglycerol transferase
MFTFFGLTFHLYGLIVGLAAATSITLVEKKAKSQGVTENDFWSLVIWIFVAGLLGARLWHVATDFHLYQHNLLDAIKIWQGGLSILGGVAGGILGLWGWRQWRRQFSSLISVNQALDLAVFGLPIGQAIGRWGNYVNQELYGLPSNLPWAIGIDRENRLPEFSQQETFHPLFAYEMLATGLFGAGLWWFDRRRQRLGRANLVGTGKYFWGYVWYYSVVRFGLDFWRVEKMVIDGLGLGLNQLILVGVVLVAAAMIFPQWLSWIKQQRLKLVVSLLAASLLTTGFLLTGCRPSPEPSQSPLVMSELQALHDRSLVTIQIDDDLLTVELVNTTSSITQGLSGRTEIGSDGMLFVLGQPRVPTFWMKEMQFDLDIVWISGQEVIGVTADVPAPAADTPLSQLPNYSPDRPADLVLELPAGRAAELGVGEGSNFQLATPESNLEK